jgi:hypothetical protein
MHWCNILVFSLLSLSEAVKIEGSFKTKDFYRFVSKFGFIKTEKHQQKTSFGYIYGNVSSDESFPKDVAITLAVLDRHHFLEFYGNR